MSKWTIGAILKLNASQFNKLNLGTKMEIVRQMEKLGNKRIERLQKAGLTAVSSALHARSGKKFHTRMPSSVGNVRKSRKANLEQRLSTAFGNAKNFLGSKSSTIKGAQKTFNRASKDFENFDDLIKASKAQQNKFWKAYNNLKDIMPNQFQKGQASEQRLKELWKIMVTPLHGGGFRFKSVDSAIDKMLGLLDQEYKTAQDYLSKDNPLDYSKPFDEGYNAREEVEIALPKGYKK